MPMPGAALAALQRFMASDSPAAAGEVPLDADAAVPDNPGEHIPERCLTKKLSKSFMHRD